MAPKTNAVKVCGRRTNVGSPQSWWVDTGIFVNEGHQLTIDASNPGGVIRPWGGHEGFEPAGQVGHEENRDWEYALANITDIDDELASETGYGSLWFGSLIGKIGRDGLAFYIGESRILTVNRSGTLFLAFNDGVSFEDNSGYWNVDVTFEELVQLAPSGYGTPKTYADRMNTSLVDDWGVILTAEQDLPTSVNWDEIAVANVIAALTAIDDRIQTRTSRTFKEVFAGLELRLSTHSGAGLVASTHGNDVRFGVQTQDTVNPRLDDRTYGQISPISALDFYPSTIPYGFFNANDKGIENTVIHELGHIIANRSEAVNPSNSMYVIADSSHMNLKIMPDPSWESTIEDSPDDIGIFWENRGAELGELVPDNFLNWVRNSYVGVENAIDNFDPEHTNTEQQRASAYWVGGIEFTDPLTQITATSPGIDGFVEDAVTFAVDNNAGVLLRSLGIGETDEDCQF